MLYGSCHIWVHDFNIFGDFMSVIHKFSWRKVRISIKNRVKMLDRHLNFFWFDLFFQVTLVELNQASKWLPSPLPVLDKCALNLTKASEKNKICPLSLKWIASHSHLRGLTPLLPPGFWMHKEGMPFDIAGQVPVPPIETLILCMYVHIISSCPWGFL